MKIVVVGGGTAGYVAALSMQHKYPEYDITVIENSEIGIIGVGEATTVNFLQMLKNINVDLKEFMSAANATIKLGTLFSNWNDENIDYFLPLIRPDKIYNKDYLGLISSAIKNDNCLSKIDENSIFALENKIPKSIEQINGTLPAVHLDTHLCSRYLKKIALLRNITIIDSFVQGFESDEEGNVKRVLLSDGGLDVDFIFDCSGFNRLIIGKFYKEPWISVNDMLPINQSVVGPAPINTDIPPYVKITAMNYGWSFQIPTSGRYGIGYNFDNNYISEEEAILEVKNKINKNWEHAKTLKYNAGFYENHFIKNCIAVGLSGSFFEPLEATAIMTAVSIMNEFTEKFNEYVIDKNKFRDSINEYIKNLEKDIIAAIYVHYVTNKTNNGFWKNFTINNKMPKEVENFLELMKTKIPPPNESTLVNKPGSFINDYFIKIYYGNGLRNFDVINQYNDKLYYQYLDILNKNKFRWKDHKDLLDLVNQ
jgi:tryptophan halogenase